MARRWSLLARMAVALTVLTSFSIAIALFVAVIGALLGFIALGWLLEALTVVSYAPGVTDVLALEPWLVVVVSAAGLVAVGYGWWRIRQSTATTSRFESGHYPVSLAAVGLGLASLYLLVVEGSKAVVQSLDPTYGFLFSGALFAVLAVWSFVGRSQRELQWLRRALLEDTELAANVAPEVASITRRLAQLVDVPTPEVRILESPRPESFTLGSGETAVITVSTGMIDALTRAELEAVVAHEISHLVNGDSRLLTAALTPVLIADNLIEEEPHDFGDELSNGWFRAWKRYGQFGVAVLSRGREWSADAGAAALTGSPAALASALETLEERRAKPTTDLREWEGSVAAMDILPTADPSLDAGPFRTHPPTADRIAALQQQVRAETGRNAV